MRVAAGLRHPDGVWGWGGTVAAAAVAVVPQVVVLAIVPDARSASGAAMSAALVASVVTVASGIYIYLHHRLTNSDSTAWLATGMIFAAGFWMTVTGLDIAVLDGDPGVTLLVGGDLLILLSLLVMVHVSARATLRFDPAAVGLFLAFAASAAAIAVAASSDAVWMTPPSRALVAGPLAALGVIVALEVRQLALPSWVRDRLALAIAAITFGRACVIASGPDSTTTYVLSIGASTLAAAVFLSTSLATLRLAIRDDRIVISALQHRLATTTAQARADRERLHEVKGTIAGIASASRLIHHEPPIPVPRREMLEEMLERESARLQRLLHGAVDGPMGSVDVDDVLRPLVVARQAQGQRVAWQPSGAHVWTREDDLAVVVNVLLDNAARHASGRGVAVFTRDVDDHVQVVVADSGPGIPEDQRPSVFDPGTRGPDSTGEGIGLYVARRLMLRCGGYLHLDESWLAGAAFVVGIRRTAAHQVGGTCSDTDRIVAQ